ncbi:MAG: hypothetical protein RML94_09275 [Bacteroidia bacterium]|nr:hypothetical protein [Bacteroidia bacterium]
MGHPYLYYNTKIYFDGTAVAYPVFAAREVTIKNDKKRDYDRKNKISERGCKLSFKTKRMISSTCHYLFHKYKNNKYNRLKFYTFTVEKSFYHSFSSEKEADNHCIKSFSKCLENLKKNYPLYKYCWVAEKTEVGVIHFHCIFDCSFIDVQKLSSYWAKVCGFTDHKNSVHLGFKKGEGTRDFRKIRSEKALSKYLSEYMKKGEYVIYGRPFGCCRGWKNSFEKSFKSFEFDYYYMSREQMDYLLDSEKKVIEIELFEGKYGDKVNIFLYYFRDLSKLRNLFFIDKISSSTLNEKKYDFVF